MGEAVSEESAASTGAYRCINCGHVVIAESAEDLPPCSECGNDRWEATSGDGVGRSDAGK